MKSCINSLLHPWPRPATRSRGLFSGLAPLVRLLVGLAAASQCARAEQLVVANYGLHTGKPSVLAVDLVTGNRTTISSETVGTGPMFVRPTGLAREANGMLLLCEESPGGRIFRIDPATGNRTLVTSDADGLMPKLGSYLYGVAVEADGNILVAANTNTALYRVNPVTGARSIVTSPVFGFGTMMRKPFQLLVEPDGNIVFTTWSSGDEMIRVHPITGFRTLMSAATVGTGVALRGPTGMVQLPDGDYGVVNTDNYLLRVDPASGDRAVISSSTVGTGPTMMLRYSPAVGSDGKVYIADMAGGAILHVDLATGNRRTVSSVQVGTGPTFDYPLGMLSSTLGPPADTTAPTLVSSSPADNATGVATTGKITLTFSEKVTAGSGTITLRSSFSNLMIAAYSSLVAIDNATVTITVPFPLAHNTTYEVIVGSDAFKDAAGNAFAGLTAGQLDFTTAAPPHQIPTLASVKAPAAGSYKAGTSLGFTVTYTGDVIVSGTPRLALNLGGTVVYADYTANGSSATSLNFHYTVAANDSDADGTMVANVIDLNGGSIKDSANNDVGLAFNAPTLTEVLVDTTAPSVALSSPLAGPTNALTIPLTIAFTEPVTGFTAHALNVMGATAGSLSGSGKTYTVDLTPVGDGLVTVDLAANTAVDAAGNGNFDARPFSLTIDRKPPAAPAIVAISDDTGASAKDHVTSDATLVLSGIAEPGSVVTLSRLGAGVLGTATAATTGAWSFDSTATTLAAGEHSFTATARDAAGNESPVSAPLIVTIDTTNKAPTIASVSKDTGKSATDGITSDNTLTLAGTAEANSTVTLTHSGLTTALGTATADANGAWTFDHTAATLADGVYLFNATTRDLAGNGSAASADFPVVIDTAAPDAPAIATVGADTGVSATDLVTNDTTLALDGAAEAGSRIELFLGQTSLGTFDADAKTGAWSFDYTRTTLGEGTHTFTAIATDAAGNPSKASADFVVTIDTTAPLIGSAITASGTYKSSFDFAVTASSDTTTFAAAGLPAGLAIDPATGAITGVPVESGTFAVQLGATDAAGNSTHGALEITIGKVNLTVAGITANDRVYDGTNAATLNLGSAALVGIAKGDTVTLDTGAALAAFADKHAGTAKPVSISGLGLSGADAAHYTLTPPTATASIAPKAVTVTGIAAADRVYNGSASVALDLAGATLDGVSGKDTVSLATSGATGAFADAGVGTAKPVTIGGLTLSGADAANYALTLPTLSATVRPASVSIVFGDLSHVYDGTSKQASVTATPSVAVNVSYSSATLVDAGSYTVTATVRDPNYTGSASATLTIAKATQSIALDVAGSATLGTPVPVAASASSGLPVTLSIVSGNASLSGSSLVLHATGSVTLRATQAGNANIAAVSAEATVTALGKLEQTMAFSAPADRLGNSGAFALNATASSGLPVAFAIVSGPAMLSGDTVTLTGATGQIIVRASQPGNDLYAAAPDVTASFNVSAATLNVFFGTVMRPGDPAKAGDIAATLPPDSNQGSLLVVAPALGVNTVLDFTLNSDGTFTQNVIADLPVSSNDDPDTPGRAAAPVTLTISGSLVNGRLEGMILPLGVAFSADVLPVTGPSAAAAGLYKSSTLAAINGSTYSIVGTNNEMLVLARTPEVATGGLTTLEADGTFGLHAATAAGTAIIRGTVDEPTTTVTGTISLPGRPDTSFAGLVVTTTRTDRLVNLSSRVRIGAGDRVLITGFVIGGTEPKQVLVRGIGPGLAGFGVEGALANPRIRIYRDGELVAENDDWATADGAGSAFSRVGAFGLGSGSADAALLATLPPGAYTAQVLDSGGTGVALAEIYDASVNPNSEYQRLVNISTRGEAGTGENVLIGGFIVTGNAPKKMLIRGVGPGLAAFGVDGALADPRLRVFRGSEELAANDHWSAGSAAETAAIVEAARATGAFALAAGSRDAAVILTLAPGQYTAQVSPGGTTAAGVALVEIYEIPE